MKLLSVTLLISAAAAVALSTPSFSQSPYNPGANNYNRYSYDSGAYNAGPVGQSLYDAAPGYGEPYAPGAYSGALYDQATPNYPIYPNGISRSGSASSIDSGAAFNENRGYPAAYGYDYIGE